MICKKCGQITKKTDRWCMNCGSYNLKHPKNIEFFDKLENKDKKEENKKEKEIDIRKIYNDLEYPKIEKSFYILNIAILIIFLGCVFNFYKNEQLSTILIALIVTLIINFYSLCYQKIYFKCYEKWWSFFIPIYNLLIFFKIILDDTVSVKLISGIIQILGYFLASKILLSDASINLMYIIFFIILFLGLNSLLCKKMGLSFTVSIFLGIFMIPVLAFNDKYQIES